MPPSNQILTNFTFKGESHCIKWTFRHYFLQKGPPVSNKKVQTNTPLESLNTGFFAGPKQINTSCWSGCTLKTDG